MMKVLSSEKPKRGHVSRVLQQPISGDNSYQVKTHPQSNSHTFLARILQKWYISDTICKNLARILVFRQTCQILADQTFLADSDISCKILAGQDISGNFQTPFPIYFQDSSIFFQVTLKVQAFSSKILPRSDIFFQVTSKIRHFLPSYFQDQAFSSKLLPRSDIFLQDLARPDIFLHDLARPDIIFQDLPRYLQE